MLGRTSCRRISLRSSGRLTPPLNFQALLRHDVVFEVVPFAVGEGTTLGLTLNGLSLLVSVTIFLRARAHGAHPGSGGSMMPDRDAIERTLRAYAAAWAAGDREGWLNTFADLATQEDPVGEGTRRGREEIGEFWDRAMSAYESIEIVPRGIFVTGREAAMEWTLNAATPEGIITFEGVDVLTFDE